MKEYQRKTIETVDDEKIIDLYWNRDDKAIQLTDIKYGKFLYNIAYNILHDKLDCEECQNDTYLGVWNSIPPTRPGVFPAYISRIMRNVAMNKYREKASHKRVPSEMTVSLEDIKDFFTTEDTPHSEYLAEEIGRVVNDYLSKLSPRERYVFISRYYMNEKLEVIARELNVNTSTVHRDIEKIKLGLKSHLERNDIYV